MKAALFDMDGVIVDTSKYHYITWKMVADNLGIYFDEVINERLKGVSRMESLEIILERSDRIYSQSEKIELTEYKNGEYLKVIANLDASEILPGVVGFIEKLRMKNIKTAVCSSSKSAKYIIGKLGLGHLFDEVIGGDDISKTKPDPEVFMLAANRFSLKAEDCVVFEDAYSGVQAAKAAGMTAIGLGDMNQLSNADIVFDGLEGVENTDFIKQLLR